MDIRNNFFSASDTLVSIGAVPGVSGIFFNGSIAAAPTVSAGIVEDAAITLAPASGAAMNIHSTSTTDNSIIRIAALGPNGTFIPPFDIALTGTTPISIGNLSRINSLSRITGDLVGQVRVEAGGNLHGFIQPGGQIMQTSRFTVPSNHRFSLNALIASITKDTGIEASVIFTIQMKPIASSGYGSVFTWACQRSGNSSAAFNQLYGARITGPFDISITALATAPGIPTQVYCSGLLVNTGLYPN